MSITLLRGGRVIPLVEPDLGAGIIDNGAIAIKMAVCSRSVSLKRSTTATLKHPPLGAPVTYSYRAWLTPITTVTVSLVTTLAVLTTHWRCGCLTRFGVDRWISIWTRCIATCDYCAP